MGTQKGTLILTTTHIRKLETAKAVNLKVLHTSQLLKPPNPKH